MSNEIHTPVLDFLEREAEPLFKDTLAQFEKFRDSPNDPLPYAVERVRHTFVNGRLAGSTNISRVREWIQNRLDRADAGKAGALNLAREYEHVALQTFILRAKKLVGTELMRVEAFEPDIDFQAAGWEGPKPSELMVQLAAKAEAFLAENENIVKATLAFNPDESAIGKTI